MRIGILTFHYTTNQGSVLQAYCTYNWLKEKYPDADIEIINLIPLFREFKEIIFIKKKFPFFSIEKWKKYKSLRKFTKLNFQQSRRVYYSKVENQIKYINHQRYDYIFTGSDTVWFSSKYLKYEIPNIYFLPEKINANKIAISASVDPLNNKKVYLNKKKQLYNIFQQYKVISVRDKVTFNLLSEIGVKNLHLTIDPTLIYPFENRLNIAVDKKKPTIKKIGLGIVDKSLTTKIKLYLESIGQYSIINFFDIRQKKYDFLIDELNLYSQCNCIITDRFHRTIFSLKLANALTLYIEHPRFNKEKNSKGRDLLQRIGLGDKIIRFEPESEVMALNLIREKIENWDVEKQSQQEKLVNNFIQNNKSELNKLIHL